MRWDRLFHDLEDQLASGWEAERAAEAGEEERLRLAGLRLRDRLAALPGECAITVEVAGGGILTGRVAGLGIDCVAIERGTGAALVPLAAVLSIGMPRTALIRSLAPTPPPSPLAQRVTLGFVLRDLVRRRAGVVVHLHDGRSVSGTLDRAGADHLDVALHDAGGARRADDVTAYRIVAFAAVAWIALEHAPAAL